MALLLRVAGTIGNLRHPGAERRHPSELAYLARPDFDVGVKRQLLAVASTSLPVFKDKVMARAAAKRDLKYVFVLGDGVNQIDPTGEEMLTHLTERLHENGIEPLFTGLKKQMRDVLERTGLNAKPGSEHFFRTEDQALEHT